MNVSCKWVDLLLVSSGQFSEQTSAPAVCHSNPTITPDTNPIPLPLTLTTRGQMSKGRANARSPDASCSRMLGNSSAVCVQCVSREVYDCPQRPVSIFTANTHYFFPTASTGHRKLAAYRPIYRPCSWETCWSSRG